MKQHQFAQAVQWDALERMAAFAAGIRGHQLGGWKRSRHSSAASCAVCRRTATVYRSLVQPEIEGDAVERDCGEQVRHIAA